jgi:peptidoglycan/LPS O-acetylase OafA/YrhL
LIPRNDIARTADADKKKLHLVRIDVLRAIAILCVFLLHWFGQAYGTDHLEWNGLVRDPRSAPSASFFFFFPLSFGWMGVPLFFVISGFCIHASALKHNELQVGRFFWRRFWRIYPPYFAALALAVCWSGVDLGSPAGRAQLWSHLLLVHNASSAWIFALNGVFWSLAVEAQLYCLYPLLWRLRERWGIGGALKLTFILSVGVRCVCALFFTDWNKELSGPMWTSPLLLWFDWTLGAYLAEHYLRGARAFPRGRAVRWGMLALVFVSTWTKPTAIFTFSLASAFFALACETYLGRDRSATSAERMLVPLGVCSYSFYLIHYPLVGFFAGWLRQLLGVESPVALLSAAPIALAFIFGISFLARLSVENGSVRLGQLLWPAKR